MSGYINTGDKYVHLNIGGKLFTTHSSTLQRIPESRLAKISRDDPNFDPHTGQYFFDRSSVAFQQILDGYRTGHIHISHCMCGPFIKQELDFWGLDESFIAECCWKTYSEYELKKKKMAEVEEALSKHSLYEKAKKEEESFKGEQTKRSWWRRYKMAIWLFLEDPAYSIGAKVNKTRYTSQ